MPHQGSVLFLMASLLLSGCGTEKSGESPKKLRETLANTCEEVAEDFGEAMHQQSYKRAYEYTTAEYQATVNFADFAEKHRTLHDKAGNPSKWGIPEIGYFQTDLGRGVGMDFGNERDSSNEVIPFYVCIVMFSEQTEGCRLSSVDCKLDEDFPLAPDNEMGDS